MMSSTRISLRIPSNSTPTSGERDALPSDLVVEVGLLTKNVAGTSDGSRSPIKYWSSKLYVCVAAVVTKRGLAPSPLSLMALPSSTEAPELKKKLQWANWRPRMASDNAPVSGSLNGV